MPSTPKRLQRAPVDAAREPRQRLAASRAIGGYGVFLLLAVSLARCNGTGPRDSVPPTPKARGVEDFTTARIRSVAEFRRLAAVPSHEQGERPGLAAAKFVITHFDNPQKRQIAFLDGREYTYHDEWYSFRLFASSPRPPPFDTPRGARLLRVR